MRTVSFESLVRQVKHDVGSYIFQHQDEAPPQVVPPCGGQIDFNIQKVKMSVTATLDQSSTVNAGLKVPINLVTLEAGGSRGRTISNSLTVNLTIWPDPEAELIAIPPPSPDFEGTPIADALNQLRRDLIRTADTAPCFTFGTGTQDNTVKWGFQVTEKEQFGGKLTLVVFSIGADASQTRTYANTIEATFAGTGQAFIA